MDDEVDGRWNVADVVATMAFVLWCDECDVVVVDDDDNDRNSDGDPGPDSGFGSR